MNLFVIEFVTGGGFLGTSQTPPSSFLTEGRCMLGALVENLQRRPDTRAVVLRDHRLTDDPWPSDVHTIDIESAAQFQDEVVRQAIDCEGTIVIAPETDQVLWKLTRRLEQAGARLLSPPAEFVAWASDKQRTADRLNEIGAPLPVGHSLQLASHTAIPLPFPFIAKPDDGAGSDRVRLVDSVAAWHAVVESGDRGWRVEQLVPGQPASVSVLCGPRATVPLAACLQFLSADGHFRYLGGRVLEDGPFRRRAVALMERAAPLLHDAVGFVGIDIVFGFADDGVDDRIIEVNPRLTTSFVGLAAACDINLAAAMVDVVNGRKVDVTFSNVPLDFQPNGQTTRRYRVGRASRVIEGLP